MAPEPLTPDEAADLAFGELADRDPAVVTWSAAMLEHRAHDGMMCPRAACGQPVPMGSLWLVCGLLYCSQECSTKAAGEAKARNHSVRLDAETDATIPPQRRPRASA